MKQHFTIYNNKIKIPSILWGNSEDKLIIAVHGDLSNKEDAVIELLAKNVVKKNYCVLSFDLPQHGERKNSDYECNPQNCISDLAVVYNHATTINPGISLFACSIGAYFSLLAYHKLPLQKTLFLSPVVNMKRVIENMMNGFNVNEEKLRFEKRILLPIGKTLDWDYYTYVKQNPVNFKWNSPISILYGSKDTVSERSEIDLFADSYNADLAIMENGEHYFSSEEQLTFFEKWLNASHFT